MPVPDVSSSSRTNESSAYTAYLQLIHASKRGEADNDPGICMGGNYHPTKLAHSSSYPHLVVSVHAQGRRGLPGFLTGGKHIWFAP